ncbi:MAG: hypothetical protein ACOYKN_17170 [Pirellula sp.]
MDSKLMQVIRTLLRRLGFKIAPQTLQEITISELRRDRVEHQQKIGVINRQIEQIETNKDTLFQKGVAEKSDSLRVEVARHIRILSLDIQGKAKSLRLLFKELEAITGLLIIKENQEMIRQNGLTSIVAKMDLSKLTEYVHLSTVEGQLQWEKLVSLCGNLEDSRLIGAEAEGTIGAEIDILRQMQAASDAMEATGHVGEKPRSSSITRESLTNTPEYELPASTKLPVSLPIPR